MTVANPPAQHSGCSGCRYGRGLQRATRAAFQPIIDLKDYAGLNLLASLATDMVKLDMELIRGVGHAGSAGAADAAAGHRGHRRGVETEEELAALSLLGVRYVQGFLFGEPQLGKLQPYPDRLRQPISAVG